MKKELWNKILEFDFDNPPSEYGFSTRLANENFWTREFTIQAILEYKKFMYLAAISDQMVSPSQIVDTVWHLHLIFTQSYEEFCFILSKKIQHIPSTHNRNEYEKFNLAKERTTKLYELNFGDQPRNIWIYSDMFDSLNLKKAKYKIRTFLIIGILGFIILTIPSYFLLRPIYEELDNPYFIIGLIIITVTIFASLDQFNNATLKAMVANFDKTSFIFDLQPFELIYLKTQKLSSVINGTINELIEDEIIKVNTDKSLELTKCNATNDTSHLQITSSLTETGVITYPNLLRILLSKPIFWNISNCMDAFVKYFLKSEKFVKLFTINFIVLATLTLLSFTRVVTGIMREKPILQIVLMTILLLILTSFFLQRMCNQVKISIIPDLYKKEILPKKNIENSWRWTYYLLGTAALTSSFIPLVNIVNRNSGDSGSSWSSCGSDGGSSCGSSCSSCGGCGGD